jgi:hypothetical protein
MSVKLDLMPRELDVILGALRNLQYDINNGMSATTLTRLEGILRYSDSQDVNSMEIDVLCEKLNCVPAQKYNPKDQKLS